MIDLLPILRKFIIDDPSVTANLTTYDNSKAVFTRRPVPEDAKYPFIIINPQSVDLDRDFLDLAFRDVVHNVIVYGQNDTSDHYRQVEETAFLIKNKFLRLTRTDLTLPTGFDFVRANSIGPFPAPTDDETKIGRAVSVTISYNKVEN